MNALIGTFGLLTFIVGLALVIKPVARLKVPTRRRAAAVAGIGLAAFITGIVLTPQTARNPAQETAAPAAAPASQAAALAAPAPLPAAPAQPSITAARIDELAKADRHLAELFDRHSGRVAVEIDEDSRWMLGMSVYLPQRGDGFDAKIIGQSVATAVVKELVATDLNPRTKNRTVKVAVLSRDADDSITGAKRVIYFGRAHYDPSQDRVGWTWNEGK